jgi:hypothetical protein
MTIVMLPLDEKKNGALRPKNFVQIGRSAWVKKIIQSLQTFLIKETQ